MTTILPIDPETEQLAQEIAAAKGKPVSVIVREALEASAREIGLRFATASSLSPDEKRRQLLEISNRSASRPILDPRTPEEIIGYDDRGLLG